MPDELEQEPIPENQFALTNSSTTTALILMVDGEFLKSIPPGGCFGYFAEPGKIYSFHLEE
jgi:hypothetical protein